MKFYHDNTYLDLMRDVLANGAQKGDRTGTGTISVFSREMRFNLSDNSIPLLTSKKMHTRSIIVELLWFLAGDIKVSTLQENGIRIWNEWEKDDGTIGPGYGMQWRRWPKAVGAKINYETDPPQAETQWEYIDQIAQVIDKIKNNPNDRRIIVSAWNVSDLNEMALPPCHAFFQFYVNEGKLSCKLTQRSADVGLGVPYNIVQYSILTHMIAQVTGLEAGEFIWSGGDIHIYNNHIEALKEQLLREPFPSPRLKLNPEVKEIDDFTFDDFAIEGYESHPLIKMKVSV